MFATKSTEWFTLLGYDKDNKFYRIYKGLAVASVGDFVNLQAVTSSQFNEEIIINSDKFECKNLSDEIYLYAIPNKVKIYKFNERNLEQYRKVFVFNFSQGRILEDKFIIQNNSAKIEFGMTFKTKNSFSIYCPTVTIPFEKYK